MKVDMVMPQMGESIAEATILKWKKNVGDKVNKDEVILEISTDKVDSEIPAPASGTITELLFKENDVVPVKTKIAVIDTEGSAASVAAPTKPAAAAPPAPATPRMEAPAMSASGGMQTVACSASQPCSTPAPYTNGHSDSDKFYSPLVKSLAEKHGISLAELDAINGSGAGGRVNKDDFLRYIETRGGSSAPVAPSYTATVSHQAAPEAAPRAQVSQPAAPQKQESRNDMPNIDGWAPDGTKIVPMDNMRQAIAEHMVRSKHTSPHVYSVQEIDVTNISKWRKIVQPEFEKREGFKLSFTPLFLDAAVRALVEFPIVNSSVDGKKVIYKKHINLGCAVAIGKSGLIVPVIKRAEEKNLVGIARGLNDLALRARSKKLLPDDVQGGTFTVTNPGTFGTIIGYPIINQPQVAILSLGAIKKRAMVIDDMIAIREMVYLTLSYDHRIIDGAMGGSFLAFLRDYLENWDVKRPLY